MIAAIWLLSLCACASTPDLSKEERAKMDPAIVKLLSRTEVDEGDYDVAARPDGVKEFGVIIHASKPDEIKAAGVKIQSIFGNVLTARLSLADIEKIVRLSSVWSVENGSRNYPH
jgi:hypothetical protein